MNERELVPPAPGSDGFPLVQLALAHCAVVLAGLLLYVVATRVRHERRHPAAAFAWVVTIAVLPYAGIVLFLLFGTSKLPRQWQRPPHATHGDMQADMHGDMRGAPPWAGLLLDGLGLPGPAGNLSVRFHADGREARDALLALIQGAQRRVVLSTFLLGDDDVGNAVVAALAGRARAGIEVCVLLDAVARLRCTRVQLRTLRSAGVGVRWAASLRGSQPTRLNLRYHRKLAIGDGAVLWSGGRNLAREYFVDDGPGTPWEDLTFHVHGRLALDAERGFSRDWCAAGGAPLAPRFAAAEIDTHPAQLVSSGPDHADDNVYALLLAAAFQATRSIVIVTPYFIPDEALLMALRIACRRGVRVTLLLPGRSNHRLADWGRGRALRDLCSAGATIYLFPRMLHAKAVIVDDTLALCGSANVDGRSLFLNFELMVAFYGRAEIAWLAGWANQRVAASRACRLREPSWLRDLGEGIVRFIGFQL